MKKQIFSTPQPHSKRVQVFNPNSIKVEQAISKLKSILTSFLMPSYFNEAILNAFSNLNTKIPKYQKVELSSFDKIKKDDEIDKFWEEWISFRDVVIKQTEPSIVSFCQMFVNEKFDQFNEIIEDLNLKPPQKMPLYREYDKAKKEIQTAFENLQQIILEQFDTDDDDDEKKLNEQTIKNLNSQRIKIRRIKSDVANKLTPFFMNSSQEKKLAESQHNKCVSIIEEILNEIADLGKQYKQFNSIGNELYKAENKLKNDFPPNKFVVPEMEGYFEEEEEESHEEEEKPTKENVENDLFIDLTVHRDTEKNNNNNTMHDDTKVVEKELIHIPENYFSPIKNPSKQSSNQNQDQNLLSKVNSQKSYKISDKLNHIKRKTISNTPQKASKPSNNQKNILTPQKPTKLIDFSNDEDDLIPVNQNSSVQQNDMNNFIDLTNAFSSSSNPKTNKNNKPFPKPPIDPDSINDIDNIPDIKPLVLDDDPDFIDPFNGISLTFSSSSDSSDAETSSNHKNIRTFQSLPVSSPLIPHNERPHTPNLKSKHLKSKEPSSSSSFKTLPIPSSHLVRNSINKNINKQDQEANSNINPNSTPNENHSKPTIGQSILRNKINALTKEKETLKSQLTTAKNDLAQLHDDYNTIVVQLQIAYEENKENDEATEKMKETIEQFKKEKESLNAKIRELQQVLLSTPTKCDIDLTGPSKKLMKLNENSDSSSDEELNNAEEITSQYQIKFDTLTREKDALYENISKLADENAYLKDEIQKLHTNTSNNVQTSQEISTLSQTNESQVKLLEEDIEYFTEELSRVWLTYDALLGRITDGKNKDDSVFFECSRLRKEKDKLHTKLNATKKELTFLKDLRKVEKLNTSQNGDVKVINYNAVEEELRKKLEKEKKKNEALVKALREERQKAASGIRDEDEHRQLFNAKLTINNLQRELQKVSSMVVHVKGKNKRLKMKISDQHLDSEEKEHNIYDEMNDELNAMRRAYESAVDWGYAQQELMIREQSEKEVLKMKYEFYEQKETNPNLDVTEEILNEMRGKIEENLRLQQETSEIRDQLVEILRNENENDNIDNISTSELLLKVLEKNGINI